MISVEEIIKEALSQPKDAIRYALSKKLRETFPHGGLLETDSGYFDLRDFESEGLCTVRPKPGFHSELEWEWWAKPEKAFTRDVNGWYQVEWQGHTVDAIVISMKGEFGDDKRWYLLGPNQEIVESFFAEVCRWNAEIRGEVLIFNGGCWQKSEELFQSINQTSYEDVILAGDMREEIRRDFERFFASREAYEKHGIPWKRGVIFLGPPGNGKTQMVKAVANGLGVPCLYVRSFQTPHGTDHGSIYQVFERARETAPCLLILEDLDSLVNSRNRSFFLNEMDGFASNTGIVTIATANHPEKLDPAILDRPSRFDRKYNFSLPEVEERARYMRLWNATLDKELTLSEEGIQQLAEATEEFSYAYIKELFLSGMMAWIDRGQGEDMASVLLRITGPLREQMKSTIEPEVSFAVDDEDGEDFASFVRRFSPR